MDMPPVSMYGDPRGGLDQLSAAHHSAAAAHMNHAMQHNPYVAAVAAANNHAVANSVANHVMGGSQVPDAQKRDKDAIYGWESILKSSHIFGSPPPTNFVAYP